MSVNMYFDIETGPCPDAELFKPIFEPSRVLKDPIKIAADLADKEASWRDKLALSATTGRIMAIGWAFDNGEIQYMAEDKNSEDLMIISFFNLAKTAERLVGFNSHAFDLPFIFRRALKYRLEIPYHSIFSKHKRLSSLHVDLMEMWGLHDNNSRISLDTLSRFLGIGGKNHSGKHFFELFQNDREAALDYLKRDIELTREIAIRMGYATIN